MSRLIDADKLIQEMSEWYWDKEKQKAAENDVSPMDLFTHLAITTVQEQPTAFNVDKVVDQLEEERENVGFVKATTEASAYIRGINDAIEIVKGGGVDGN